ncbi:MAG: hypothetical protein ACLRFG_03110 [Clostridia bacterium]
MKKMFRILMIMALVCSSVLFASCDAPYAKMTLTLYESQQEVTADDVISLTIDSTETSLATKELTVKVAGVEDSVSKEIVAYSQPTELANVIVKSIVGDTITLGITAINGGEGKLVIMSKGDSSKSISRDLSIRKVAQQINAGDKRNYAVLMGDSAEQFVIPATAFRVLPDGATDEISYDFIGAHTGATIDGNVVTISPTISLTRLNIYAHTETVNTTNPNYISLDIIHKPDNIAIATNRTAVGRDAEIIGATDSSLVNTEKLTLVINTNDIVNEYIYGDKVYFNQAILTAQAVMGDYTEELSSQFKLSAYVYNLVNGNKVRNDTIVELMPNGNNSYLVYALSNTSSSAQTYLHIDVLVNGYESEFANVFTIADIPLEVISAPTGMVVKADSTTLELTAESETSFSARTILFDTYSYKYGTKYTLSIIPTNSALTNLFGYKIAIPVHFLTAQNLAGASITNKYTLTLRHSADRNIQFTQETSPRPDGLLYAVSENLSKDDYFYLKYTINADPNGELTSFGNLFLQLTTTNNLYTDSDTIFEYLPKLSTTIEFDIRRGVTEMHFDKPNGVFTLIKDGTPQEISMTIFNVDGQVTSNFEESIVTLTTSDPEAVILRRGATYAESMVYLGSDQVNSIEIVPLRVGEYTITATSANGMVATLLVKVYVPFSASDVSINLPSQAIYGNIAKSNYEYILLADPILPADNVYKIVDGEYVKATESVAQMGVDYYEQVKVFEVSTNTRLKFGYNISSEANASVQYILNDGASLATQAVITESGMLDAKYATHTSGDTSLTDKKYITLTIRISGVTGYTHTETGYTEDTPLVIERKVKLFIYVPIKSFSLNRSSISVKDANTLGYENRSQAQVTFQATIYPANAYLDDASLWNAGSQAGETLVWTEPSLKATAKLINVYNQVATYEFSMPVNNDDSTTSSQLVIQAKIRQYAREYSANCTVTVSKAVQSQGLVFQQAFDRTVINGISQRAILLRADKGLNTIDNATTLSLDKLVNTKEILARVHPLSSVYDTQVNYYIIPNENTDKDVDQIAILRGNTIVPIGAGSVTILVVPRDAIMTEFVAGETSLEHSIRYITDANGNRRYLYETIILDIADGSEQYPYKLSSIQDVRDINNAEGMTSHYLLYNDIDFNGRTLTPLGIIGQNAPIEFTGSIKSFAGNNFGIYNVNLQQTNGYMGLFAIVGEAANIENINFSFTTNSILNTRRNYILGSLASINNGQLIDVQVQMTGTIEYTPQNSGGSSLIFGAVSGVNNGIVNLSRQDIVSVINKVDLIVNETEVSVGGVVGRNTGVIYGSYLSMQDYETISSNLDNGWSQGTGLDIFDSAYAYLPEMPITYGNQGATIQADIDLTYTNNALIVSGHKLGALVGHNEGRIIGCVAVGNVSGGYNVGGLVGYNSVSGDNIDPSSKSFQKSIIMYSYTNVAVAGSVNVGGVTGYDSNGVYYHANSEYYLEDNATIQANVIGVNNVAGFIGESHSTMIAYSYVASYKGKLENGIWSYTHTDYYADIQLIDNGLNFGMKNVAGFIAYADNVQAFNSTSSAKISVDIHTNTAETINVSTFIAQLVGGYNETQNSYVKGHIQILQKNRTILYNLAGMVANSLQGDNNLYIANSYAMTDYEYSALARVAVYNLYDNISGDNTYYIDRHNNKIYDESGNEVSQLVFTEYAYMGAESDDGLSFSRSTTTSINDGYPILKTAPDTDTALGEEAVVGIGLQVNTSSALFTSKPARATDISTQTKLRVILSMYTLKNLSLKSEYGDQTAYTDNQYFAYDFIRLNTFKLSDIISTSINPRSSRNTAVIVTSSNSSILRVDNDKVVATGVGMVTLTIKSKFNSAVANTITIYVQNAVDSLTLYQSANYSSATSTLGDKLSIGVGSGKVIYPKFSDQISVDGLDMSSYYGTGSMLQAYVNGDLPLSNVYRTYSYQNNTNAGVRYIVDKGDFDQEYLSINGLTWTPSTYKGQDVYYVDVDNASPAYVTALIAKDEGSISVTALPYVNIALETDTLGVVTYHHQMLEDMVKTFQIFTYTGATNISSSASQISTSPLFNKTITITIDTDFNDDRIILEHNGVEVTFVDKVSTNVDAFDIVKETISTPDENDQLVEQYTFIVKNKNVNTTQTYTFDFTAQSNMTLTGQLKVTVSPQKLMHMAIDNYYYTVNSTLQGGQLEYEYSEMLTDKVIPGEETLLKVNVYPEYTDYDYIEVYNNSSLKVVMQQVLLDENWQAHGRTNPYTITSIQPIYTANSIQLSKLVLGESNGQPVEIATDNIDKYYLRMVLSSSAVENTIYNLSVKAIKLINGVKTDVTNGVVCDINLTVQNKPTTAMTYTNALGKEYFSSQNMIEYIDVAQGVPFTFDYATNSDATDVVFEALTLDADGLHTTRDIEVLYSNNLATGTAQVVYRNNVLPVNSQFVVRATASRTINGKDYTTETYLCFTIRRAVVNGITIANSTDGIMSGRYGETYTLQAILGRNDITYSSAINTNQTELTALNTALDTLLAKVNSNWYFKNSTDDYALITTGERYNISFSQVRGIWNFVTASNTINSCSAKVEAYIDYDTNGLPMVVDIATTTAKMVSANTRFTFNLVDSIDTFIPVSTQSEFEGMTADRSYILMNDLKLTHYKPIDAVMNHFDGNSYEITIENYDIDSMTSGTGQTTTTTADIGLFANVSENTVLSNIMLNIPTYSLDITDVTTFNYGGIAVDNAGIITNCVVKATSVDVSTLTPLDANGEKVYLSENLYNASENKNRNGIYFYQTSALASGAVTNVNFGGLVCNNTGYISNSKVLHSIVGFGNIAGFVYNNTGTIVSSKYQYGLIRNQSDQTSDFMTAGFAINNSGTIRTSYAEGDYREVGIETRDQYLRSNYGGISCEIDATGFVFNNNGTIQDCYSDMNIRSNGIISGFVFNNNGPIIRSYTTSSFITSEVFAPFVGLDEKTREPLTTPENLIDCYYLVFNFIPDSNELAQPLYITSQDGNILTYKNSLQKYINDIGEVITANLSSTDAITLGIDTAVYSQLSIMNENNFHNFIFDDGYNGVWSMKPMDSENTTYVKPHLIDADRVYKTRQKASSTTVDDSGATVYNYVADIDSGVGAVYGSIDNPYLIYDTISFELYMNIRPNYSVITNAYRLIKDIDMVGLGVKPVTTNKTFVGSLDGNGMTLDNLTIYADSETDDCLTSIGLFKEIGVDNSLQQSQFVKNIIIKPNYIYASHTKQVGTLAGVLKGGKVSNITIDAEGSIILGSNAVGGIFGVMTGEFEAQGLFSNVTINSVNRCTQTGRYALYSRTLSTNKVVSTNLDQVSYAGGIAGIVDGYSVGSESINTTPTRVQRIKYAQPYGRLVVLGENVGFAFGYVGESTQVSEVMYELASNSQLRGVQNNGGLVGENRGIIHDSFITYPTDVMTKIYAQATTSRRTYGNKYKVGEESTGETDTNGNPIMRNVYGYLVTNADIYDNFDLTTTGANITAFNTNANAGGVVGFNNGGLVNRTYCTIAVIANNAESAGGLIGMNTAGGTSYSITTSSVMSSRNIGGAIGKIINPFTLTNNESLATPIVYNDSTVLATMAGYVKGSTSQEQSAEKTLGELVINHTFANNFWESRLTYTIFDDRAYGHSYSQNIDSTTDGKNTDAGGYPLNRVIGGLVGCVQKLPSLATEGSTTATNVNGNVYNNYMPLPNYNEFRQEVQTNEDGSTSVTYVPNGSIRIAVNIPAMHMYYDSNVAIETFVDELNRLSITYVTEGEEYSRVLTDVIYSYIEGYRTTDIVFSARANSNWSYIGMKYSKPAL